MREAEIYLHIQRATTRDAPTDKHKFRFKTVGVTLVVTLLCAGSRKNGSVLRLAKAHPDIFQMIENGTRRKYPLGPKQK